MRHFFKTVWFKIIAVVLSILILFLIVAAVIGSKTSPVTAVSGAAVQPVQYVTSIVGRGFGQIGRFFTRSSSYEARIDKLEDQVESYQKQLADYEKTKEKLKNYEDFLDIKEEHEDYEGLSATVIGKDSAANYATFVLNKGSVAGVRVNDPVICGKGQLVGVVTKVAPTYSVVSTILDPTISVSAYDIRTRENGYITNSAEISKRGNCRLSGLDRTTAIAKGGVICTAGVGGIYPRDLVIGTVKEVKNDDYDISAYAVVVPDVDITEVNEVLVITKFEGQGISASFNTFDEEDDDADEASENTTKTTAKDTTKKD